MSSLARSLLSSVPRASTSALPCACRSAARFSSTLTSASEAAAVPRPKYLLPNGLMLKGLVTATGRMAQTSTVTVERKLVDHKTLKEFKKHTKYLIHDPESTCVVGDTVSIRNCRPVSKRKRFELVEVIKGARERAVDHAESS